MDSKYAEGVPKGRIVPVYLTEDGDMLPILFKGEEELDLCGQMVAIALFNRVVIDVNRPINNPDERIKLLDWATKTKI